MQTVYFIDTSILLNILDVPKRNQEREKIVQKMERMISEGDGFILPLATIIETGNHIAHIDDGNQRRDRAELLSDLIRNVLNDNFPWVYNKNEIAGADLLKIAEKFPDYAQKEEMGLGDLSILTEYFRFKNKHKKRFNVKIWSTDGHLCARDGTDRL